jgi:hypothetical protein
MLFPLILFHKSHRKKLNTIVFTDFEDRHDATMIKSSRSIRFCPKPLYQFVTGRMR